MSGWLWRAGGAAVLVYLWLWDRQRCYDRGWDDAREAYWRDSRRHRGG